MSVGRNTSEFTEADEPPAQTPPPLVTTRDVPDGVIGNRKGMIVLRKKCENMGYTTRLTYSCGYVLSKSEIHLRHCLVLRIYEDRQLPEPRQCGETGPCVIAGATWEAPAVPGDDPWDVDYKTRGALIRDLPGRFGNKELQEYLLDPTVDPRYTNDRSLT